MAGLHTYRSNRLEVLVAVLAARLRETPTDPVAPLEVVVGSRGMERHLRHALAEGLGICARVEFPFPTAALDALVPPSATSGGADPWSPAALTWAVLEVLPGLLARPEAAPLARYLDAAPSSAVDARAWGLAARIADTFDRYVTYRPELAAAWSAGDATAPEGHGWQPALWQAVRAHLAAPPHRAERLARLAELGPEGGDRGPLHVFGLSSLAPSWLEALGHVARHRDVELYLLCPSSQYWADLDRHLTSVPGLRSVPRADLPAQLREGPASLGDAGHPLLGSWGRSGRDLQILLESLPDGFEDDRRDLFLDPTRDRTDALRLVQSDILAAVHPSRAEGWANRVRDPDDRSVQLHACHGATRQVEVLRTVLLELLDADPTLNPRDIVVMTPDIEAMAPLIGSVFEAGQAAPGPEGWAPSGSPRLPWELADLSVRRLNPVADALLRVLDLVDGRAKASDVLELLALEPVAERFGLSADDVSTLRGWVIDSGVRWGVDGADRRRHELPADAQNSWRFGLQRLLLGVVMADDGRLFEGVRPFAAAEGGASRRVGHLAEVCATLFEQLDALQAPRPLPEWADALERALAALTATSGQATWLSRRVREELAGLRREAEIGRASRPVAVDALRAALAGRFEVASTARHGSGGAVTFCGMVPERAVPYRVVCLLGMDEGAFPRIGARSAFDLTQASPRVGDRDVRDEDRYLLLEAVLSARDHLVVLFTGRDPRTNEPLPPAVPVSELRDALDATWPTAGASEAILRRHPLQAFDARDFAGDAPFAYDARLLAGVRAAISPRSAAVPFLQLAERPAPMPAAAPTLALEDLVSFWRHPVRSWLQRQLRLWLPRDGEEDVPDREPIELDWGGRQRLLEAVLARAPEGAAEVRHQLRAGGALPLGKAGELAFASTLALADGMRAKAAEILGWSRDTAEHRDLDARIGGERLVGRVTELTPGGLVVFRYGDERESELLEAWIRLLAWRAQDPEAPGRALLLFGKFKKGAPLVVPVGLELDDAEPLADLVALRRLGTAEPLPFFPATSKAVAAALRRAGLDDFEDDGLDDDPWAPYEPDQVAAVRDAALLGWSGTTYRPGEGAERHNRHAFGDQQPFLRSDGSLSPRFASVARTVWGPLDEARRSSKHLKGWR